MESTNIQFPFFQNTDMGLIKNEKGIREGKDVSFNNIYLGLKMGFSMNDQQNHSNDILSQEKDDVLSSLICNKEDEPTKLGKNFDGVTISKLIAPLSNTVSDINRREGGIEKQQSENIEPGMDMLLEHLSGIVNANSNDTGKRCSQILSEPAISTGKSFCQEIENNLFENFDIPKISQPKYPGKRLSNKTGDNSINTNEVGKNINFAGQQQEKEIVGKDLFGKDESKNIVEVIIPEKETNSRISEKADRLSEHQNGKSYWQDPLKMAGNTDANEKTEPSVFIFKEGRNKISEAYPENQNMDTVVKEEENANKPENVTYQHKKASTLYISDAIKTNDATLTISHEDFDDDDGLHLLNKLGELLDYEKKFPFVEIQKEGRNETFHTKVTERKEGMNLKTDEISANVNDYEKQSIFQLKSLNSFDLNANNNETENTKKEGVTEQYVHENKFGLTDDGNEKRSESKSDGKNNRVDEKTDVPNRSFAFHDEMEKNNEKTQVNVDTKLSDSDISSSKKPDEHDINNQNTLGNTASRHTAILNEKESQSTLPEEQTWTQVGSSQKQFIVNGNTQDTQIDVKTDGSKLSFDLQDEADENFRKININADTKLNDGDISSSKEPAEESKNSQSTLINTAPGQPAFLNEKENRVTAPEAKTWTKDDSSQKQFIDRGDAQDTLIDVKMDGPKLSFDPQNEVNENFGKININADTKLNDSNISSSKKPVEDNINSQNTLGNTSSRQPVFLNEKENQFNTSLNQTLAKDDLKQKQFIPNDDVKNIQVSTDKKQHNDNIHKGNITESVDLKSNAKTANLSLNDANHEKENKDGDNKSMGRKETFKNNESSRQESVKEKTGNQTFFQWESKTEHKINTGEKIENYSISSSGAGEKMTVTPHQEMPVKFEGKEIHQQLETKIVEQIIKKAALEINNAKTEIKIDIKPESLGTVKINVVHEKEHLSARIVADTLQVKEILDHHLTQLKNEFNNSGLNINDIDVSIEHEKNENNEKQHEGQNEKTRYHQKPGQNIGSRKEEESRTELKRHKEGEIDYYA